MKENRNLKIIGCDDWVKVKKIGDEIEVRSVQFCNRKPVMQRQRNGKYQNMKTGEIIESKKYINRGDNLKRLRVSNQNLADIIKENTIDCQHVLYITLTYRGKQFDSTQVQLDFRQFIKRLRKQCTEFGEIEYINVYELHADNSYHIHADLFFNKSDKVVYLPDYEIEKIWGLGFVKVGQPRSVDEMIYYLTPHIINNLTPDNEKMHEKALRQMALPASQRLYHYSKSIKRPKIEKGQYSDMLLEVEDQGYRLRGEARYPSPATMKSGRPLFHHKQYFDKDPTTTKRQRI